jgi:hypothetical protein
MPNPERAAKLSASLAKGFGEDFTFTARVHSGDDVNLPRVPDASRIQFTATGVFAGGTKDRHPAARGFASDHAQGVVISAPRASFEASALPWTPVEGDLCGRVDTGDTFAVARTLPDGFGRTLVYFTAKKR